MINKKIVISLLFLLLFIVLFPKTINAALIEKHETPDKKGLYDYGAKAVGNTIRIWRSGENLNVSEDEAKNRFVQDRETSHIYCVQHKHQTNKEDYYDYTVENYVEIRGNVATNSRGEKKEDNKNFVLANIIERKDSRVPETYYKKGYSGRGDDQVRNLAIKHYLTTGGWMSAVGNKLGVSGVSGYNASQDENFGEKALKLINKVSNYYKNTTPSITADKSSIKANSEMNTFGPIVFTFTGNLTSIKLYNGNKEFSGKDISYKVNGKTKTINQIKSGDEVTIVKNNNYKVTKIQATVSGEIIVAELWFCTASNALQNLLVTRSYTYDKELTANITVTEEAMGTLTIQKKDAITKKIIKPSNSTDNVAKFRIFKTGADGGWLKGGTYNTSTKRYTGTYSFVQSATSGTIYETHDGVLTIEKIETGSYKIYEIVAPQGYSLSWQSGYGRDTNYPSYVYNGTVTIDQNENKTIDVLNEKTRYITIYKKDAKDKKDLQGAGFKVYNVSTKRWVKLKNDGTGYEILEGNKNTYENATVFEMKDSNTKYVKYPIVNPPYGNYGLRIFGLDDGTYRIYECKAPSGKGANGKAYVLNKQKGYSKKANGTEYVDTGEELTIDGTKGNYGSATYIYNTDEEIKDLSIKGYVWIDTQPNKDEQFNSKYDSRESKVAGVTVRLRKKGDTSTEVPTTTTKPNGEYVFEKVLSKSELKDYYVEFDYSNLDSLKTTYKDAEGKEHKYINYIPVAFNSTKANEIVANGSRALLDEVPANDANLKGIATTYKGTDKETTYGLSGNLYNKLIDKTGTVLNNINLGIKRIPTPDYNLTENIVSVKIVMKGYTYTYIYGGEGAKSRIAAPKVNWQKNGTISGYTANIYPSDIAYDIRNSTEELEMYVKYRIDITNTMDYNNEELYQEKTLHIKSLKDTFDTNRYTLHDNNWTVAKNGNIATIKDSYLEDIKNKGIDLKKPTATKYIEFSVNHNAILDILNHPNGIIETYPTKANAIGYHKYTRNDYSWKNNIKNTQNHTTVDIEKKNDAPYLIFKLGPERVISGKVFKDSVVTNNGEVLGNGEYNDGEKGVADVNVELLDLNGTETDVTKLSVSNVYGVEEKENNTRTAISKIAQVKTNEDGNYSLNGIVPGYYYLRFVYGNGTYKITDLNGNVIDTNVGSKIDNNQINAKNYKSTIVTNKIAKNALLGLEEVGWYKKINNDKLFSVAKDNLEQRKAVNEGTLNSMMAGTGKMSITVENTNEIEALVNQNAKYNQAGKEIIQKLDDLVFPTENEFKGLNLGIIEVPRQDAEIKKVITNVKLVDSEKRTLYNGNPENVPSQGVVALSDLDNEPNGGSTYVRAEVAEVNLYGSKLELTYEVRITNLSDINYYDIDYYWYGTPKAKKEVTLTPTEVMDYLDNSLTYEAEKSKQLNNGIDRIEPRDATDIQSIKVQPCVLKGWKALYTNKNKNRDKSETTDKVSIVASRILSSHDEDMEIISRAEITKIERTPDPADTDTPENERKEQIKIAPKEVNTNGMVQALFTITPPTGKDKLAKIIYIITGTITLIMLSIGIGVIKKKVSK